MAHIGKEGRFQLVGAFCFPNNFGCVLYISFQYGPLHIYLFVVCFYSHIDGLSVNKESIVYGIGSIFLLQVFFQPLTETVLVIKVHIVHVFIYGNLFLFLIVTEYPGVSRVSEEPCGRIVCP